MSIKPLHIKVNDLQPYYYAEALDSDGNAIADLTDATIYCTMKQAGGSTPKIDRQTAGISITDGPNAQFEYQWQDGDTDTEGRFYIEFEVNPASGGKFTVPQSPDEIALVVIGPSLDSQ